MQALTVVELDDVSRDIAPGFHMEGIGSLEVGCEVAARFVVCRAPS